MNRQTQYISPRLSPILRKYITPQIEDVSILKRLLSFDEEFNYIMNKKILDEKNRNICIHPYNFNIILTENNESFDFIELLNYSYLPEHYIYWYQKYSKVITKDEVVDVNVSVAIDNYYDFSKTIISNCEKRFILFPVRMTHLVISSKGNYSPKNYKIQKSEEKSFNEKYFTKNVNKDIENHACFMIVDTLQGKAYYMDPMQRLLEKVVNELGQYSSYYIEFFNIIKYKCEMMLKTMYPFLGIKKVEILDVDAPQSITDDKNCLFWSLLLCDIMIKNLKEDKAFNPKVFVKSLLKKYNTKEKLERVIRRYISYVYESSRSRDVPSYFYRNLLKNTYVNKNYI
jgi:hypothetical protein